MKKDNQRSDRPARLALARAGKDRRGRDGATLIATIGRKYPCRVPVLTHGLTAQQVADRVRALEARQLAKEQKLDEIQAAVGIEFHVNADTFRITDAIIRDRGNDAELVVQIASLVNGRWRRIESMPLRKVVGPVTAVPGAAAIEQMARDFVERAMFVHEQQADLVSAVLRALEAR